MGRDGIRVSLAITLHDAYYYVWRLSIIPSLERSTSSSCFLNVESSSRASSSVPTSASVEYVYGMDGDPAVEPELDTFSLILPLPYRVAVILVLGIANVTLPPVNC